MTDFYDKEEVERVYNHEVAAIIKVAMDARDVVVFDHTFHLNEAVIESRNAGTGQGRPQ